jgi:hypothetical protein
MYVYIHEEEYVARMDTHVSHKRLFEDVIPILSKTKEME